MSPEARIREFLESRGGRRLSITGRRGQGSGGGVPGGNGGPDYGEARARLELALFLENEFAIVLTDVEIDSLHSDDPETIASLVRRHLGRDGG